MGSFLPGPPHPHPPQKGVGGGKTKGGKGECIWGVAGRVMPKVVPSKGNLPHPWEQGGLE